MVVDCKYVSLTCVILFLGGHSKLAHTSGTALLIATRGLPSLVLVIPNSITHNLPGHTGRASGPLTAVKHVRDLVNS